MGQFQHKKYKIIQKYVDLVCGGAKCPLLPDDGSVPSAEHWNRSVRILNSKCSA